MHMVKSQLPKLSSLVAHHGAVSSPAWFRCGQEPLQLTWHTVLKKGWQGGLEIAPSNQNWFWASEQKLLMDLNTYVLVSYDTVTRAKAIFIKQKKTAEPGKLLMKATRISHTHKEHS